MVVAYRVGVGESSASIVRQHQFLCCSIPPFQRSDFPRSGHSKHWRIASAKTISRGWQDNNKHTHTHNRQQHLANTLKMKSSSIYVISAFSLQSLWPDGGGVQVAMQTQCVEYIWRQVVATSVTTHSFGVSIEAQRNQRSNANAGAKRIPQRLFLIYIWLLL